MRSKINVKVINGVLIFKCKLSKKQIYKVMETSKYKSIYIFNKPQIAKGITNQTEDNMSVTFIDWDNTDFEVCKEDLHLITRKFKMPPFYVFQTKENNYHAINLKKFPNGMIPRVLLMTRCDSNYTFSASLHKFRSYVLRLSSKRGSKKPKFKCMVGEMKNLDYEISKAHLDLLNKIYPKLPHIKYKVIDKFDSIRTQIYQTSIE